MVCEFGCVEVVPAISFVSLYISIMKIIVLVLVFGVGFLLTILLYRVWREAGMPVYGMMRSLYIYMLYMLQ